MVYKHEHLVTPALGVTDDPEYGWSPYSPPNFTHCASWAKRARFTIVLREVTGAPTAFDLGFTVQSCSLVAGGLYRYQVREWYDLTVTGQVPNLSTFADETTDISPPLRTVVNLDLTTLPDMGADIRLARTLTFTGGTSPTLKMDITRELWS